MPAKEITYAESARVAEPRQKRQRPGHIGAEAVDHDQQHPPGRSGGRGCCNAACGEPSGQRRREIEVRPGIGHRNGQNGGGREETEHPREPAGHGTSIPRAMRAPRAPRLVTFAP